MVSSYTLTASAKHPAIHSLLVEGPGTAPTIKVTTRGQPAHHGNTKAAIKSKQVAPLQGTPRDSCQAQSKQPTNLRSKLYETL
jgi:hypothetical protein